MWTPLDCAAAKGHAKVADILLEYDTPVDPTDETKVTVCSIPPYFPRFQNTCPTIGGNMRRRGWVS